MEQNKPTPEELAAQLRKPHGENGVQVGKFMNEGNKFINELSYKALSLQEWDNVLEIGPGNGAFVSELIEPFEYVGYTGLDYSGLMIEEAKKVNATLISRGRVRFVEGNISGLDFKNKAFNKIITVNTLYFWPEPQKNLAELNRVLADDGKLIMAIRPKRNMEVLPITEFGFTLYSKEDIIQLLEKGGFNISDVQEHMDPPMEVEGQTIQMESLIILAKKV